MTRIAYLGPAGTFTEAAARRFDLPDPDFVPVDSPAAALDAVRAGEAEFAVVAIENSVDGAVTSTSDALVESGVQILAETELEIAFAIMSRRDFSLDDASSLTTHPVAYQQVKGWVSKRLPGVKFVSASSNAAAARMVADGEADVAAAPERAAEIFDLEVHARGVADMDSARTRFVLVGPVRVPPARTGNDRTSIVFQTPNEPGTLVAILQEFAYRGVDMSRIESRPTRQEPNTYNFFVDLVGHVDDAPVAEAMRGVYLRASWVRFLGSWPKASGAPAPVDQTRIADAEAWVRAAREGQTQTEGER
ncbi:Prephenate dehydratase [Corynebacterium glaucum]|uniref:prephenate dehydratase n=1 Tax=Corynebacterium glaucum TaxID=187491 RepID=UPI0025B47EFF|nr:prephenate dehydratase [Corynebacterium glaucum]WJZ08740.1 Prephenate dehydratase [Corynebacterium glaucum]